MQVGMALRLGGRIFAWIVGFLLATALLWLAANRLLDERPDPRRDAFLRPGAEAPDKENTAVGIAGLGAPSGADFMKFGVEIKKLYEARVTWADVEGKANGPGTLKLTVKSEQITCWIDPDWDGWTGFKECLPFDKAPQVLAENRELLERYKRLYTLERNVSFGFLERELISYAKLAIAEMQLDMKSGRYEAAYIKWRDHFRFTRTYLHGQSNWVSKSIGMVDFGFSLALIEDLLVRRPALVRDHYGELLELLRPHGIGLIEPGGLARAQYLDLERYLQTPYTDVPELSDTIDWLGWKLGQEHRILNRYLAYSMDYENALSQPWGKLSGELSRMNDQYVSFGWKDLVDPFGAILLLRQIHWQVKPTFTVRQVHIIDGNLRLASLAVRIVGDRIRDERISDFLHKASPELSDPFSGQPMRWNSERGQIFFVTSDDGCDVSVFRVPAWDKEGKRQPPKLAAWQAC